MRHAVVSAVLVLGLCGAVGFAQAPSAKSAAKPAAKAAKVASHSTSGVVKSVDANTLVITRGGKDTTFALNGSTQKDGSIANGANVTVRYEMDGKSMVATAVTARPSKEMAKASTKPAAKK